MSDRLRNSEDAWAQVADELDDANEKISALRSRVAELEGALRPFQRTWIEAVPGLYGDDDPVTIYVSARDLRNARAALTKEPTP